MKKIFSLFCAAMLTFSAANAKVVMTENFEGANGAVGTLNQGPNTDMGTNSTNWWSFSGSSNYIQVAEGTLSYSGYSAGAGNKAYLYSGGADDLRQFAAPVTSGKVYLAAIVNVESVKASATADYCLSLGNATSNGMYAKLYTKSVKEGEVWTGFKFGIAKSSESASYVGMTETVYAPNTAYLVVLEYEFVEGDQNDTVRLYVNPTSSTTVPTIECVQSVQSGSGAEQGANAKPDANKIASVNLRQGTNTPKVYVDEIKVATSWSELFSGSGDDPGDDPGDEPGDEPGDDPVVPGSNTIAAAKLVATDGLATIDTEPVVIRIFNDMYITVQDATGALTIADYFGSFESLNVGDKLSGLSGYVLADEDFAEGFFTIFPNSGSVASTGNALVPLNVTLADFTQYGPAYIQVSGVQFPAEPEHFAAGSLTISQNGSSANLQIPQGCDIIGEAIPASADVAGIVCHPYLSDNILLNASADVTNRVPRQPTGTGATKADKKAVKVIRDGQLIILRDGKALNVLGAEL